MLTAFRTADHKVLISIKRHSFTITLGDEPIYYFDLLGRFLGAFMEGTNYVRGLSGKLLAKQGIREEGLKGRVRREILADEKHAFLTAMYERIQAIRRSLADGVTPTEDDRWRPETHADVASLLGRVQAPEALAVNAQRFHQIYKPISILPPDQYLSVVLQVTEGCSHNRCTFCNFYRDRRFRIKNDEEVATHIQEVKAFLGESIRLRRSIFLADANAVVTPQERLLRTMDQVCEAFPLANLQGKGDATFRGIDSFMDVFDSRRKSVEDFRALADRGLRRVYLGLETGFDALLNFVRKAGSSQDAVAAAGALKEAGVQRGVIVMLGMGGHRYADDHVAATIRVLNAMRLGKGDILYTSEFVEHPELEYAPLAREQGIEPMGRHAMLAQRQAILDELEITADDKPQISHYDIREFIY